MKGLISLGFARHSVWDGEKARIRLSSKGRHCQNVYPCARGAEQGGLGCACVGAGGRDASELEVGRAKEEHGSQGPES